MGEKRVLREAMRELRKDLGPERRAVIDEAVAATVEGLPEWRSATHVLTYLSVGAEVDTRALVAKAWEAGKVVALPRVVPGTRTMSWHVVTALGGLVRSGLGVLEPDPATPSIDPATCPATSVALVPGLAFDEGCHRLGYGGGFYDAFLAAYPGTSVGLAREAQVVPSLADLGAIEPHDLPCDVVVTERGTYAQRAPSTAR